MKYFWGTDTYAAREAVAAAAAREAAQIRWVDRADVETGRIADIVGQSASFFGRSFAVVKDPAGFPKAIQEDLAIFAEKDPAAAWLMWERGAPDKRSKLWRAVKGAAREFPAPASSALVTWLQKRAGELDGAIAAPAAELMVARLGSNRWRLENELRRLLLAASPVTVAFVEREVAAAEAGEIFAVLDALGRGERRPTIRGIEALLAAGHGELYILSMLGYQFRTLLAVRSGLDRGLSAAAIAQEGKLHPYAVEKNIPLARRLPYARWRDGLTRILATDFAIKQGRVDARTGLLMLVLTLSQSLQPVRSNQ